MSNLIKIGSDFYILASSLASRRVLRVLAHEDSFAIFDVDGDIFESPLEALGFFYHDTRYLSRLQLRLAREPPALLNSFVSGDNTQVRINLTNPDLRNKGSDVVSLPRNSIQLERSWTMLCPQLYHRIVVRNHAIEPIEIELRLDYSADFADLFELRGVSRERKGQHSLPQVIDSQVVLEYRGLDQILRRTTIRFDPVPKELTEHSARFELKLMPDERKVLEVIFTAEEAKAPPLLLRGFHDALRDRLSELSALDAEMVRITSSNQILNSWLEASRADLLMITAGARDCRCVRAGIPWFATLFGRDGILTALSLLPFAPFLSRGTLRMLASLQGTDINETRDEQPGKIVHEIRFGEMARTGEVPFGRYYGGIDETPLFLILFARYVHQTADLALARELWPNVLRALEWIELFGDRDGDLYVEYQRDTPRGLVNQGWKDSFDAISHADGTLAHPPIALCEVQAYVHTAYLAVAKIASYLGEHAVSARLLERAERLGAAFLRDFWLDHERTVALALDYEKKPCRVMASNAAHCLGMLDETRAQALAERLLAEDMFSGWGLRTLSVAERRYNPMSYHNGSIWPHDNAIAAMGLSQARFPHEALKLIGGMFDAAAHLHGSLPELFCGFPRESRLLPVPYPVACHPQAWAAASVFLALQAILGLRIDGFARRLQLDSPLLPAWLDWLRIDDLPIGGGLVSLVARRPPGTTDAALEIFQKQGNVSIEIRK